MRDFGNGADPRRAQFERDVADVVGTDNSRRAEVWQAIGMLMELRDLEERAALTYLCDQATMRGLNTADLAAELVARRI